jgi:hypothetical protein
MNRTHPLGAWLAAIPPLPDRSEELRLSQLQNLELGAARPLIVGFSLVFLLLVLWLVRRRSLREEYTPIWLLAALSAFIVAVFESLLVALARAIGAWTLSSALFFFAEVFLIMICLHFAVRMSKLTLEVKNLAQEVALLKAEREQQATAAPRKRSA